VGDTWWGEAPAWPLRFSEGLELSAAYLFWLLLNAAEPVPALAIFTDNIPGYGADKRATPPV
jgi:hypothetical protein